jgi:hypothetical protein
VLIPLSIVSIVPNAVWRTVSPEVLQLGDARGNVVTTDCGCFILPTPLLVLSLRFPAVNFSEFDREPSGQVTLIGRVK